MKLDLNQKEDYKETELGLLPEDWEVKKLEDLVEFKNGLWKGKKGPFITVKVLRNTNFNNDGTINFYNIAELDVEKKQFETREIKKNDIILERSGGGPKQPVGRVVFFEKEDNFKYSFSNFTSRLRVNNKEIIFPKYLFYFLFHFYIKGETNNYQNRTTGIRNLDFTRYKNILITLPPLSEQKKIAYVLSTVQEAKEKTEDVIKATKELKKSMMKHLFTYGPVSLEEAENIPLKETEFGLFPEEWEVVKLGEIFSEVNVKVKELEGNLDTIPILSMTRHDGLILQENKFDKRVASKNISNYKVVKKGQIVVGFPIDEGVIYALKKFNNGLVSPTYNIWEVISSKIEINFLDTLLRTPFMIEEYRRYMDQTVERRRIIKKYNFINIKIPLPPLSEQQKIASILSAIDQKIEAEESKKKALEDLFKSLLHNLMTAKIRVNHLENVFDE